MVLSIQEDCFQIRTISFKLRKKEIRSKKGKGYVLNSRQIFECTFDITISHFTRMYDHDYQVFSTNTLSISVVKFMN